MTEEITGKEFIEKYNGGSDIGYNTWFYNISEQQVKNNKLLEPSDNSDPTMWFVLLDDVLLKYVLANDITEANLPYHHGGEIIKDYKYGSFLKIRILPHSRIFINKKARYNGSTGCPGWAKINTCEFIGSRVSLKDPPIDEIKSSNLTPQEWSYAYMKATQRERTADYAREFRMRRIFKKFHNIFEILESQKINNSIVLKRQISSVVPSPPQISNPVSEVQIGRAVEDPALPQIPSHTNTSVGHTDASKTSLQVFKKHSDDAPKPLQTSIQQQKTLEVCLAAVTQNGDTIQYLTDEQRTPEVCLAAVKQDGLAIEHLTDSQRTPEVCLAAVKENGLAIQYLTDEQRTLEVCLAAVKQEPLAIKYLK